MTNADYPLGERVVAVETDIKHMLDSIVRIEGGVGRIENVVIKETTERLEAGVARLENVVVKDATERLEAGLARLENVVIRETTERLEAGVARLENVVIRETTERLEAGLNEKVTRLDDRITETRDELKADIARVEGRIVETKEDYQRGVEVLLAAMYFNKTAVYVMCGTVIVGLVAALMRGTLF